MDPEIITLEYVCNFNLFIVHSVSDSFKHQTLEITT